MGRSKLVRFRLNAERGNVIEPGKNIYNSIKGKWYNYFNNNNPLILEIGCGRGEYTTGLANLFPNKNIVGIDIKGSRLWKGSSVALEQDLYNTAFLRTQIQHLENFFNKGEAEEIWITFPDPKPKERDDKNRLTGPRFLNIYKSILKEGGVLNLKTDNLEFFSFTLQTLKANIHLIQSLEYTYDVYNSELLNHCYHIKTTFEMKYLAVGSKINYLRCTFHPMGLPFVSP